MNRQPAVCTSDPLPGYRVVRERRPDAELARVAGMHYDHDGRFVDAGALPRSQTPRYRRYRDAALAASTPFAAWWERHPEYRRQTLRKLPA